MQLGTADVLVRAKTSAYQKKIDTAEKRIKTFGKTAVSSIGSVTASFTTLAGVAGVGALTAAMVSTGAKFESEMATVQGVMRATTDEYNRLKAAALEMGEKTEWSASQSAEALRYMGMAGWSAEQSIDALPGVLNLATAANMDLGQTADIVTDSLTAMGLGVQDLSRFNDILTGATTRSNTNIQMMGESLKYAAPHAHQYGVSIESLAAMIGTLANAGIKASDSGTDLRQAMVRNAKAAKELGTAENDLIGTLRAAKAAGWDVNDVTEKYGMIASKSVLVLMNQIDAYDDLYESLKNVKGETTKLAEIKLDTLTGDFKILGSTIESVFLSTSDNINRDLRGAIQDLTKTIRENREAIIDLFSGIVIAGTEALDIISKISRSISLLGVTAASSDKSLWDWLTLDDDGAKRWLQEIEDGTAFLKDQLHDVREEIEEFQSKINEADGTDEFIWSDEQVAGFQAKVDQLKVQEKRILESIQNIQDASNKIVSPTPGANHRNSYYSKIFGDGSAGNDSGGSGNNGGTDEAKKTAAAIASAYTSAYSSIDTVTQSTFDFMMNKYKQDYDAFIKLTGDKETAMAVYSKNVSALTEKMYGTDTYDLDYGSSDEYFEEMSRVVDEFQADYKKATMTTTEYELDQLKQRYENYAQFIDDTAKLDEWYKAAQKDVTDKSEETWSNAFSGWANSYSSTLNDMLWGSETTFSDIATSFGKMITEMIIQQELIQPFVSGATGSGGWISSGISAIGGLFASAQGNVFPANPVGISAYSNQIVSSPTVFPFAKGIGLMGEDGDEGILPLTRMSTGNLGVEASMGSTTPPSVTINIENKTNSNVEASQSQPQWDGEKWVIGIVLSAINNNTGNFRTTMKAKLSA